MMNKKRYTFECIDNNCLIYEDDVWLKIEEVVDLLNEQQTRIEMLEKSILDCLFNNKSIGILAEEMGMIGIERVIGNE